MNKHLTAVRRWTSCRAKITRLTLPRYGGVDEHVNAAAGLKGPFSKASSNWRCNRGGCNDPRTEILIVACTYVAGRTNAPSRTRHCDSNCLHLRWDQKPDHHSFDPDRRSSILPCSSRKVTEKDLSHYLFLSFSLWFVSFVD